MYKIALYVNSNLLPKIIITLIKNCLRRKREVIILSILRSGNETVVVLSIFVCQSGSFFINFLVLLLLMWGSFCFYYQYLCIPVAVPMEQYCMFSRFGNGVSCYWADRARIKFFLLLLLSGGRGSYW